MYNILNIIFILFSLAVIIFVFYKAVFSLKIHKITIPVSIAVAIVSICIYIKSNKIIALIVMLLILSEILLVNILYTYTSNLLEKTNNKIGIGFNFLNFFYVASLVAIINMYYDCFPSELLSSNCIISFAALFLIIKYSVSIVMLKEINDINLFYQLFLLLILMTGSIFSFANFNYSINMILGNISTKIKITDYIFLYSSIFTLNYDGLMSQLEIDKLFASVSMIYSYFFISAIFATIITRLNNKTDLSDERTNEQKVTQKKYNKKNKGGNK